MFTCHLLLIIWSTWFPSSWKVTARLSQSVQMVLSTFARISQLLTVTCDVDQTNVVRRDSFFTSSHLSIVERCTPCTDTSDPRDFGPKTVRHYIFGTEMSYFSVSVPKWHFEVSLGQFGQCRSVSTTAEVPRTDQRRVHVLVSLQHLTSICTIHRDLPTASQDILYIRNHTRTFTFDSLTFLRPCEQFRWWWWSSSSWSSSVSSKNSAEN